MSCIYLHIFYRNLGRFFSSGFLFGNKTGVFLEGLDLALERRNILREGLHAVLLGLVVRELGGQGSLSVGHLEPVDGEDDSAQEGNSDDGSQDGQSLDSLSEKKGKSQQEGRDDQETNQDVDNRDGFRDASSFTQAAGSIERDVAHERDWVPDKDTGDVEEQVGKSNLHGVGVGKKGGKEGSDGSSNVGSQGDREHLFKTNGIHTDQRSEHRGGDGRRLDKDGDSNSDKDGKVSVDVGGLVDDTGRHTEKHLLEQPDHAEKADEQDDQTNDENGNSGDDIIGLSGTFLEESRAGGGSAGNKTNGAGLLVLLNTFLAGSWVVILARLSLGNGLDKVLVGLDDLAGKRSDPLLDRSDPLFSVLGLEVADAGTGKSSEVSGDELNRKEDTDSQKVEHIVDGGSSEGTFELISISHLSHGDNGVGD